jgi:hypothetical protein
MHDWQEEADAAALSEHARRYLRGETHGPGICRRCDIRQAAGIFACGHAVFCYECDEISQNEIGAAPYMVEVLVRCFCSTCQAVEVSEDDEASSDEFVEPAARRTALTLACREATLSATAPRTISAVAPVGAGAEASLQVTSEPARVVPDVEGTGALRPPLAASEFKVKEGREQRPHWDSASTPTASVATSVESDSASFNSLAPAHGAAVGMPWTPTAAMFRAPSDVGAPWDLRLLGIRHPKCYGHPWDFGLVSAEASHFATVDLDVRGAVGDALRSGGIEEGVLCSATRMTSVELTCWIGSRLPSAWDTVVTEWLHRTERLNRIMEVWRYKSTRE